VRDYINGKKVLAIAAELEVVRASVNQWLRWYDTAGTEALRPAKRPGRLTGSTDATRGAHAADRGRAAGGGVHRRHLDRTADRRPDPQEVRRSYHNHHIPRLLHQLDFSVQRPRKRLARADWKRRSAG